MTLSPVIHHEQHCAEVEAIVQAGTAAERDAALDDLLAAIGGALAAERTRGGRCDGAEAEAPVPVPVDPPIESVAALEAAVIPVVLHSSVADPLAGHLCDV